jgi:hypothetical protein
MLFIIVENQYRIIKVLNILSFLRKDKMLYTNNVSLAVGLGIKKVIIFLISPNLDFVMDYDGKYGIGPNTFYIPFHN